MHYLLKRKFFLPLFLTQFFGAFNDNAFKLAMLTLISYHLSSSQAQSEHYQALAGALFTLPFFIFSGTAGQLADRFDKAILTRFVKAAEVLLMILGSFALYDGGILMLMITLGGMGIHSAFFGPIKYSILPDHIPQAHLLHATALIEASTFLAVLTGTILGTLTIGSTKSSVTAAIILINIVSLSGFVASLFIPRIAAKHSDDNDVVVSWHLWQVTITMLKEVSHNRQVFPAILALSWFWLLGAIMLTKLPDYTHYVLKADTSVFALFLAFFSLGIAAGSLTISKILAGKITLKYVPIAMLLLSYFIFDLYLSTINMPPIDQLYEMGLVQFFSQIAHWRIAADFFLFSLCGGMFVVPLYTFLQVSCDQSKRARTIAANNIYNALSMIIGTLVVIVMLKLKLSIALVFLLMAITNGIAAIAFWLVILLQKHHLIIKPEANLLQEESQYRV